MVRLLGYYSSDVIRQNKVRNYNLKNENNNQEYDLQW